MTSDAPDYTLLSDVNITGTEIMVAMDLQGATIAMPIDVQGATIALPVDIQGQTINLDVNIVASTVTIDVNISAQTVDVKIYTPSGRWVVGSELLTAEAYSYGTTVASGSEVELISLTGRGRIKQIGFYFERVNPGTDVYTDIYLRVYVDGETSPSISLRPLDVDRLNGYLLIINLMYGINRVTYASDDYVSTAQASSPEGALTCMRRIFVDSGSVFAGGYVRLNAEFTSSASIKVYNKGTSDTKAYVILLYGEYL